MAEKDILQIIRGRLDFAQTLGVEPGTEEVIIKTLPVDKKGNIVGVVTSPEPGAVVNIIFRTITLGIDPTEEEPKP